MDKTNSELIEIIKGKNLDVKGLSKMNRAQLCKLAGYDDCGKRVSVTKSDSKAKKTKEKEVPKKETKGKEDSKEKPKVEEEEPKGREDFSKLTVPKLKEYLKGEGIPFKSSDKKADLVKLAESSKGLPKGNKGKEKEEKVKEEKGKEEPKGKEDFSKLTVPKLKEYLKGKGIAFKSSDKKADLVKLAEGKGKEEKRKTPVKAKKVKGELTSNKIGIDLDEWISHMLPKSPEEVKASKKSKVNKGKKGKEEIKNKEEKIDSEELYEVISKPGNLSMIVERGYLNENPHYVRHVFKSGENLLLLALKQNNDDIVSTLLNMDIDIFHRDAEGYDALDYYSFYYKNDAFFSEKLYELLIVQTDEVKRMLHYFKNNTFFKLSVEPWDSTIDLSGQKLKEIPDWFYQTPNDHTVELSLDLSNNQLTSLPSFNFMNIKYLNISHNKLKSINNLIGEFNGDVLIAHHNFIEDYHLLHKIFYSDFSYNAIPKTKEGKGKETKEKDKDKGEKKSEKKIPSVKDNNQIKTIWKTKSLEKWKKLFIKSIIRKIGFKNNNELANEFINVLDGLIKKGWSDEKIYNNAYEYVQNKLYKTDAWKEIMEKSKGAREDRRIKEISELLNGFKMKKSGHYLDVGCAEGAITASLGKHFGLTVSNINGCDVHKVKDSEGFTFKLIKGEKLPYENNSMDFVSIFMALHHIENPSNTIKEIVRVLKPNGLLLVREHDAETSEMGLVLDLLHGFYSMVWPQYNKDSDKIPKQELKSFTTHFSNYKGREEWRNIISKEGFNLINESKVIGDWRYYYDVYLLRADSKLLA